MNNSSQFILDGLPGCVIASYQPQTQLQTNLISTSEDNCRTLAYPVFFPCSMLERLSPLFEATAELPFSIPHAVADTAVLHVVWTEFLSNLSTSMLMPSFLHTLSLLTTWYLFLYHIGSSSNIEMMQ